MFALFTEFCNQMRFTPFWIDLDKIDAKQQNRIIRDHSGFVVVDGEEGDHGVIKWFSKATGKLLATQTINGGDDEYVEFTKDGFDHFAPVFRKVVKLALEAFKAQL